MLSDIDKMLSRELFDYFLKQGVDVDRITSVDIVLALLRMGRVGEAQELAGVSITHCPPYIPMWPPKPVERKKRGSTVASIVDNPCMPTSDMHRRYALVRVGMTKQDLRDKGISARDIVEWERRGMLKWDQ